METALIIGLTEGLIVETLLLGFLLFSLYKLRGNYRRAIVQLEQLKNQVKVGRTQGNSITPNSIPIPEASDNASFIKDQMERAKSRYKSQTLSSIPQLSPEHSHQVNATALRYLYLRAELDCYKLHKVPHSHWHKLDRGLQPILSKLYPFSPGGEQLNHKDNQITLLRDRIKYLKPLEQECEVLKQQLEKAQQELAHCQESNNTTPHLEKVQELHQTLNHLQESLGDRSQEKTLSVDISADASIDELLADINSIEINKAKLANLDTQKQQLGQLLASELSDTFGEDYNEFLSQHIKQLQKELLNSDHQIASLETIIQSLRKQLSRPPEKTVQPNINVTKTELNTNQPYLNTENSTAEIELPEIEEFEPSKQSVINEIKHLQENNVNQRNLIADLERKVSHLKVELSSNCELSDLEVNKKLEKIHELEKIINEFENCVATLENEVDMLYAKLADQEQSHELKNKDLTIEQLNTEIAEMAQTLDATMSMYGNQSLLSHFAMDASKTTDAAELIQKLSSTIHALHASCALVARTRTMKTEYIPQEGFSTQQLKALKSTISPTGNNTSRIDDATLFFHPNLSLLLHINTGDNEKDTQVHDTASSLFNLAVHELDRISSTQTVLNQKNMLEKLLKATQKQIKNIEVQQSYQIEEAHRIHNRLAGELTNIIQTVKLPASSKQVLSNAIQESHERMALLFAMGSTIDSNYTKLIEALNKKLQ